LIGKYALLARALAGGRGRRVNECVFRRHVTADSGLKADSDPWTVPASVRDRFAQEGHGSTFPTVRKPSGITAVA